MAKETALPGELGVLNLELYTLKIIYAQKNNVVMGNYIV